MKKKMVTVLLTAAMVTAMAAGCGKSSDSGSDKKESYTIGIEQFAEHGSLDNCREGFLKGLEDEGIKEGDNLTVKYKNAAADMGTAKQISDSLVSDKVDLVCAIATPSAQSAYNAAMKADIPVIYTAVTDPVAAELADKDGKPVGEVTGTSDKLPVEEQLKMIREMLPDAKKIGIMYTTSEANSVSAIEEYKSLVKKYDFELVEKGITTTADVSLAADDLLSKVDCITNLTDNTVVASLPTILDKANEKKIPVFGSEIEQVKISSQRLAILRHDMRHHLSIILTQLQNGHPDKAQEYIHEINSAYDDTIIAAYSGNEMLNSVLSIYHSRFTDRGLSLICNVSTGKELPCSDLSLCTILSNALENSMHALEQLESPSKWARLTLSQKKNHILFQLENPVEKIPAFVDGVPVSTRNGHGIGVRSIIYYVEQLHGQCHFSIVDHCFVLRIII